MELLDPTDCPSSGLQDEKQLLKLLRLLFPSATSTWMANRQLQCAVETELRAAVVDLTQLANSGWAATVVDPTAPTPTGANGLSDCFSPLQQSACATDEMAYSTESDSDSSEGEWDEGLSEMAETGIGRKRRIMDDGSYDDIVEADSIEPLTSSDLSLPVTSEQQVLVRIQRHNMWFRGQLLDVRSYRHPLPCSDHSDYESGSKRIFKVKFNGWDEHYDSWIPQNDVRIISTKHMKTTKQKNRVISQWERLSMESRGSYVKTRIYSIPDELIALCACKYLHPDNKITYFSRIRKITATEPSLASSEATAIAAVNDHSISEVTSYQVQAASSAEPISYYRANKPTRPPLNFSNVKNNPVELLRMSLLMVEAALPVGAIDETEENRWGKSTTERKCVNEPFSVAWREAVNTAADATSLMACQLMLEYGIRPSFLYPTNAKIFSHLSSRSFILRNATYGMVFIRLFSLDHAIRYDKQPSVPSQISSSPESSHTEFNTSNTNTKNNSSNKISTTKSKYSKSKKR